MPAHEVHVKTLADHPDSIIPATIARNAEVTATINNHNNLTTPHPHATSIGGKALGLADGNIAVLPPATDGQVLRRGPTGWVAGIAPAEIEVLRQTTEPTVATDRIVIWVDTTAGANRWWLVFGNDGTLAGNRKVELG